MGEQKGHQEIWCQPSDQPKRQFIVIFDEQDHDIAVFDDEVAARHFWEKANIDWNCYLMGTLPRLQRSADYQPLFQVKEFDGSWTDVDAADAADWTDRGRVVRQITVSEPKQIQCHHEPFEGKCIHCGVRFDFGSPVFREGA